MKAKGAKRSPELTIVLAWLVPGLGHVYLGQRAKGAIAGALIVGLFLFGYLATKGEVVSYAEHPYAFYAQLGAGLPTIVGLLRTKAEVLPSLSPGIVPWIDLGLLYTCVAGLLNVLLVLDGFDFATGGPARRAALAAREKAEPEPEKEEAA